LTQIKAVSDDGWFDRLGSYIEASAMTNTGRLETLRTGVIAGAAGGLAEIAWVALYADLTGIDPAVVARGVTTTAGLSALLPEHPATLGIGVHMVLAAMLGIALTLAWRARSANRPARGNPFPFMLAALAGVWAINFLVVLPTVGPAFAHLLPYTVSLTSKLLFGAAVAEVLRRLEKSIAPARVLALRKVRSGEA
jgi:hypothetical protein